MDTHGEQGPAPEDQRLQAIEAFEATIDADYSHARLVLSYDGLEGATFAATGRQGLAMEDALTDLLARCDAARTVADSYDDPETAALFIGKASSYKNQLEAIAPKPAAPPQKTDPSRKGMDRPKQK